MKKGLNVTLMTVAIAVMAFQAMAAAPTIGQIKDPIVGNEPGATSPTPFVFPDVYDITAKATDDSTTSVNIRWSYWYSGATEVYRINNVDRVTVDDVAIKNPVAAQKINGATTDPADVDGLSATITIRNVKYAPIGGSVTVPGTTGIIDAMPVTLFASDGTTYSPKTIMIYTDNGGLDRITGADSEPQWTPIQNQTTFPAQGQIAWSWAPPAGSVTSSTNAGAAICIETAALGDNYATWNASWGVISVAKNTVYRIRARIQGTQTSAESTQFFDFVLGNFNSATQTGFNMFGADFMFFDNEGGANAPLLKTATNGTTYEMYWCPPSVGNAAFNSSNIWDAGAAEYRKMLLVFRVMDLTSFAALTAQNDSGRLCLNNFTIDAIPTDNMSLDQIWASPATLTASNFHAASLIGAAAYQTDKVLLSQQIVSGTNSKDLDFGGAFPGDGVIDYNNLSTLADEYPIPWEADTLYRIAYKYSAVDATSAAAPYDVIWVGMDCPSNEFIVTSYVTSQGGVGVNPAMPKAGTPQEYVAFLYSHQLSNSSHPEFLKFRPRSEWANSPSMVESPGTGSTYMHGATVSKVTFTN